MLTDLPAAPLEQKWRMDRNVRKLSCLQTAGCATTAGKSGWWTAGCAKAEQLVDRRVCDNYWQERLVDCWVCKTVGGPLGVQRRGGRPPGARQLLARAVGGPLGVQRQNGWWTVGGAGVVRRGGEAPNKGPRGRNGDRT